MLRRKGIVGKKQLNRRVARDLSNFMQEIQYINVENILESNNQTEKETSELEVSYCATLGINDDGMSCNNSEPIFLKTTEHLVCENFNSPLNNLSNSQDSCESTKKVDLQTLLAHWAGVKHNVPQIVVTDLLHILSPYHKELPLDCRTLLHTSTKRDDVVLDNGTYCHIGLKMGLQNELTRLKISHCNENLLKLSFNIDGLPLFKSNKFQFWPILCLIKDLEYSSPFVVGLFYGNSKPQPLERFLNRFLIELRELLNDGCIFNNIKFQVCVHNFVCDAPARAYLKCVKGHGGYSSCDKCEEEGEYNGRVVFLGTQAVRRTDESFKWKLDEDHHLSDSPLMELGVGMVSAFPIDYMHCVCLGVTKKLLTAWVSGKLSVRLHHNLILQISEQLLKLRQQISIEFNRKPRSLSELAFWKATEFRTFLVYIGPIVLEGHVDISIYEHFLLLHCAITILLSAKHISRIGADNAGKLLNAFVIHSRKIYGKEFLVYNVHMLCHLHEDVVRFGPLDQFSCFPFESFLGWLKHLVKSSTNPLAQVYRRLDEKNKLISVSSYLCEKANTYMFEHTTGPILNGVNILKQYKKAVHKNIILCIKSYRSADSYFVSTMNKVVQIENIAVTSTNHTILIGKEFTEYQSFYNYPFDSSCLGIHVVKHFSKLKFWNISEVLSKCLVVTSNRPTGDLVCFPLIHILDE